MGPVRGWRGFDLLEDRGGCSAFHVGSLVAAAGVVSLGEVEAGPGCFVGGSDVGPQSRRFGQGLFCARCIAVGEPHSSAGVSGAGDQRLAPESGGDDIELVGGRSGPVDVPTCDRDLDLRLEQRGALQIGVRWSLLGRHSQGVVEGVSYRVRRTGDVTSGKLHQGKTGFGIPAGPMSGQQRFLGADEISLVKSDPSELVQRPAQLAPQVGAQLLARHQRLGLGFVARPAQPEDLGAMHPAAPVQAADGVRLAPPLHRLGPLLGHVVEREALQGAHQLAVHDPGRQSIELPGDRRHPGLVEQRQTLLNIAAQDEQTGFGHASDGARRRVTP